MWIAWAVGCYVGTIIGLTAWLVVGAIRMRDRWLQSRRWQATQDRVDQMFKDYEWVYDGHHVVFQRRERHD